MLLKEMLNEREASDLYQLCYLKNIIPDTLSKDDKRLLYQACNYDDYRKEFLIGLATGENHLPEFDEEDRNDPEYMAEVEAAYNKEKHIGELLLSLDRDKDIYIEALVKEVTDIDKAGKFLEELREKPGEFISSVLDGTISKDEEGYYPLDIVPKDNWSFKAFEREGTGAVRRVPWYQSQDEREHLTGLLIPEEMLEVFRKADSQEVRNTRTLLNVMDHCTVILQAYYEIGNAALIKRIYDRIRESYPGKYPAMDETEFIERLEWYYNRNHAIERIPYQGEVYYATFSESETIDDSSTPDDSLTVALILNQKECTYDYYIPTTEEIRAYLEHGCYATKPCFVRLREFIKENYLDEKTLNEMTGQMFSVFGGFSEEELEERRQNGYSMDDVEEETEEKYTDMMFDIMGNNSYKRVYENNKNFTLGFKDESKEEFKELLKACCAECPNSWYLGHSKKEVREKNLEPIGDED